MEKNEGCVDRIARAVIGITALYLSFAYSLWWLVLAVPAIITSITGFCWPYKILGINTLESCESKCIKKTKGKRKR